jgi:alpha-beta hydrolase superfamily lysophospholipase
LRESSYRPELIRRGLGCAIHCNDPEQRNRHEPRTFWLTANDRSRLFVNQWLPTPPKAVMLAHGMAEHSGRYARLAKPVRRGLYAPDQRGHGRTAEHGTLGCTPSRMAGAKWWATWPASTSTSASNPGLPIILLGHSMGSYIAQAYLLHHSASLHGAILSGSNFQPVALYAPHA